jgi:protein-L-isoaspartate(D-aspartate) O-methyltransferase
MVAEMAADGVTDEAVLAAMAKVPREVFVPHFWATTDPGLTEFDATGPHPDPEAVRLVYDMDRALAVRWDRRRRGGATSTASAPRLMAGMLELLTLRPGMAVLEIGTGTGYDVALLSELVGDAALVTSVDIDAGLVQAARGHLGSLGYDAARLVAADGADGVAGAAPFDRVVATVGCVDIAPAWLDQLAPGGFALVPLQHAAVHPLVRARPAGPGRASAELVGRSGFVAIQGYQAGRSPWVSPVDAAPAVGASAAGGVEVDAAGLWDLGLFVAVSDRRAGPPAGLFDGAGSGASLSTGAEVTWFGPQGPALRDRLATLAGEWADLGRPAAEEFACRFTVPAGPGQVGRVGDRRWVVDRIDYRQELELSRSPRSGASPV